MAHQKLALIIPVESQVRELDAKILLACNAVEHGFSVYLGSRAYIHYKMAHFPKGIYVAKSMRKASLRMFKIINDLGHEIIAWDEEGLVRLPDSEFYRHRLNKDAFKRISHLFAWGHSDAEMYRKYPHYPGTPIHVTGNPRIDFMREELVSYFEPDSQNLIEKYGEFILINTNFGQINHFLAKVGNQEAKRDSSIADNGSNTFMQMRQSHKRDLFEHFKKMIPILCETFPDINFVIRPHPSENHLPWVKFKQEHSNVHVLSEGNVIPWLMAARLLIANGCTTSIEAALLKTPAINYQPIVNKTIDDPLPILASHYAYDLDSLINKISNILDHDLATLHGDNIKNIIEPYISSLDGKLATERIVEVLIDAFNQSFIPAKTSALNYSKSYLHNAFRSLSKRINMLKPNHRNNYRYHAHRFPDISSDDLNTRIEQLSEITGKFSRIKVSSFSKHIFLLES